MVPFLVSNSVDLVTNTLARESALFSQSLTNVLMDLQEREANAGRRVGRAIESHIPYLSLFTQRERRCNRHDLRSFPAESNSKRGDSTCLCVILKSCALHHRITVPSECNAPLSARFGVILRVRGAAQVLFNTRSDSSS